MRKYKIICAGIITFILLCCVGAVSAISNDTIDNSVFEMGSDDEFISVSADDQVDNILSAQSKNANWTVNVDGLSTDSDLLSDEDDFDDDDDDDDGKYNDYDDNDYSEVDKNKEYFYNRIHSGNTLYFEFLTHLVDKCGFVLDIKNSDVNNQVYKLITNKDYSFKLYDGKQFDLKKGGSYIASFNNRLDYNIYGSTLPDVVYVKDNVNYLDEDYLGWLHWDKKLGNSLSYDMTNLVLTDTIVDSINLPYYNLIDKGLVSSFKKQLGNDCWAFSTIAALESHLMKTSGRDYNFLEGFDFSENHLRNVMSSRGEHGTNLEDKGNIFMSSSYLVRWSGPILESDDVYDNNRKDYSYESFYPVKHVQDILFIPARDNVNVNNLIKKAVMDYGAVVASMRITETDYRLTIKDNKIEFLTFNIDPNKNSEGHSVAIIGWDDNFSSDNFLNKPSGNGAFIIKDSNWECPVYVSYYDEYFAKTSFSMAFVNVEDSNNYKSIYQKDYMINSISIPNGDSVANEFIVNADEKIAAVGFYNLQEAKCTINVSVESGNSYNSLISEDNYLPGYHTVKLKNQMPIKVGDKVRIEIKFKSNHDIVLPYDNINYAYGIKFYTAMDSNVGMSYIESKDITKDYDTKAITMGLLKDKNGNFIVNGMGKINELNDNNVKNIYKFKSTTKGEIILSKILNPSTYDFIIAFEGNSIFTGSSKHVSVKVNKLSTKLLPSAACKVEDKLKFTLKHGNTVLANKPLDITINGVTSHLITNINGEIGIELKNAIKYNIKVNFNGDTIYNYNTIYHTVNVQKKTIAISQKTTEITYKNGDVVKVEVDKPNISVKLTLGGKTYTKTSDAKGIALFKVGKKPKTYTSKCYINNPNYQGKINSKLKINPLKLDVKYSPGLTLKKNKDLTLTFTKNGDKTKKISGIKIKYKIEGHNKNYKTTNKNGAVTFKTSSLKVGKYTFQYWVSKTKYDFGGKDRKVSTTIRITK